MGTKKDEKNLLTMMRPGIKSEYDKNEMTLDLTLLRRHFRDASVDGVKKTLSKGPNINLGGKTPLQVFLDQLANYQGTMLLSDHHYSPSLRGFRPVSQKKTRGYSEIVKLLLDTEPDLSTTNDDGDTLLHLVATNGFPVDIINLLIDAGASLGAENKNGETPFDIAVGESKTALKGPTGVTSKSAKRNKI